jgi:hypothetical protein
MILACSRPDCAGGRFSVLLQSSLVILAGASAFFWWRQHSARQQNAVLRAELVKLRGRLRGRKP